MDECIFCKIVSGELPSYTVYSNDKVFAFFDILPIAPGHTIVVPKSHVSDIESLSEEELFALTAVIKKIGRAMIDGLEVKGYSIMLDNKSAANQHVPHVHFHIVPRKEGDGLGRWPQGGYDEGSAEFTLEKLTKALK